MATPGILSRVFLFHFEKKSFSLPKKLVPWSNFFGFVELECHFIGGVDCILGIVRLSLGLLGSLSGDWETVCGVSDHG